MFFAMMIMFFVIMRVLHGRRRHFAPLYYCGRPHSYHRSGPLQRGAASQPAQPSAFDRLKQRSVDGDLTDEQYEDELDSLLRSPETRKSVP